MVWDQLLSSWAWWLTPGAQNHTQTLCVFAYAGGQNLEHCQTIMYCVVGLQFLLTPWLLSTCFGDWLASQSPNPSWHHRVSLAHLQNTIILCHFCITSWHVLAYGWMGHGCRHMANITQNLLTTYPNTRYYWQFWCWGCWTVLQIKNLFGGGCNIMGGACQLEFWKNCQRHAWEIWVVYVNLMFGRIARWWHEKYRWCL